MIEAYLNWTDRAWAGELAGWQLGLVRAWGLLLLCALLGTAPGLVDTRGLQ